MKTTDGARAFMLMCVNALAIATFENANGVRHVRTGDRATIVERAPAGLECACDRSQIGVRV